MIDPITLDELQEKNGWKEVLPLLSGRDLFFHGKKLVYPGDWEYIKDKVCMYEEGDMDDEKKFIVSIPPEPWSSNILTAKVVILSLNPGYVPQLNKELACMFRAEQAEKLWQTNVPYLKCNRGENLYRQWFLVIGTGKEALRILAKMSTPMIPKELWMT